MTNLWDINRWQPVTCLLTGRVWDAGRFSAEISQRAGVLKTQGFKAGDVVFLYHNNSLEFLADLFALWATGAVAAALSPALTIPELENLYRFAGPKAILIAARQKVPKSLKIPVLDLAMGRPPEAEFSLKDKDFGLILFTSGTTAKPKGVVHTKATIEAKTALNLEHFGRSVFQRSLCVLSSHFVAGLFSSMLTPLAAGGEVFLFPDPGVAGAGNLGHLIDDNRITIVNTVPSMWNIILKTSPKPTQKSLQMVSVVSAPLANGLKAGIITWAGTENVYSLYGTTETGGWNTRPAEPGEGSVGKVLGGKAAVLCADGRLRDQGNGELVLKTPGAMTGYFKRPDLTKEVFLDGWFKTGDLVEIDGEGLIYIQGREKTQINRAGIKIIPEEVEALLETHPVVKGACVFAYPDPVMGEGVAVLIQPRKGEKVDFSALREWCKSRIRAISIPEKWFSVVKLPRNQRGKIDRLEIQARYLRDKIK